MVFGGVLSLGFGCSKSEEAATTAATTSTGAGGNTAECNQDNFKEKCGAGDECGFPSCAQGKCGKIFAAKGAKCKIGAGVVCDGAGKCVEMHCTDGVADADEIDVDCGGTCMPCKLNQACTKNEECLSGHFGIASGAGGAGGSAMKLGTCKPCADDSDCNSDKYCDTSQSPRVCVKKKAQGEACDLDKKCATGNCIDGFCCDSKCAGGCDTCSKAAGASADGTCTVLAKGAAGSGCASYVCDGTAPACPTKCSGDGDCAKASLCDDQMHCVVEPTINGCLRSKAIDVSAEASPFNISYASSANPASFNATIKGMATQLSFPICLKIKATQQVNFCVNPPTCSMAAPQGGPLMAGGVVDMDGVAAYDKLSPIQPLCFSGTYDPNNGACYTGGKWACGGAGVPSCNNASQNAFSAAKMLSFPYSYPFFNNSNKTTQTGALYVVP